MIFIIIVVVFLIAFGLSYKSNKKKEFKTKKERVQNTQIFCLTWLLIAILSVVIYVGYCNFAGISIIPEFFK